MASLLTITSTAIVSAESSLNSEVKNTVKGIVQSPGLLVTGVQHFRGSGMEKRGNFCCLLFPILCLSGDFSL